MVVRRAPVRVPQAVVVAEVRAVRPAVAQVDGAVLPGLDYRAVAWRVLQRPFDRERDRTAEHPRRCRVNS